MAQVLTFLGLGYECNSFLIIDKTNVLIDTGTGLNPILIERVLKHVENVDMIINTHAHLDHVGGNEQFSCPVAVHEEDAGEMESGRLYGTADLFGRNARSNVSRKLKNEEILELGDLTLKVISTPGHTPGSICLLSNEGHLFTGDTVFSSGSFGRTDLPGGDTEALQSSLESLKNIDFKSLMTGHMECTREGKKHLALAIKAFGDMYAGI